MGLLSENGALFNVSLQDILSRLVQMHATPQQLLATDPEKNGAANASEAEGDQLEPISIKLGVEPSERSDPTAKAFFRVEILLDEETDEIIFYPSPDEYLVSYCDLYRNLCAIQSYQCCFDLETPLSSSLPHYDVLNLSKVTCYYKLTKIWQKYQ